MQVGGRSVMSIGDGYKTRVSGRGMNFPWVTPLCFSPLFFMKSGIGSGRAKNRYPRFRLSSSA
jgi:hypothetical protein